MNLDLPILDEDKNVCISLSGGLDSTVLLHSLVKEYGKEKVKVLSFYYNQRHSVELEMAQKSCNRLGIKLPIINLDYLGKLSKENCALIDNSNLIPKTAEENSGDPQVNTYVPYRNAQFAFITASFAETNNCQYIFQGLNAVDEYGYWDTSVEFVNRVNSVLELNRMAQIQFITPFVEMYKEDELLLAKELSEYFKFDVLEYTWSCYNGVGDKECGKCNTCSEKIKGYILAEYSDKSILDKFNITKKVLEELKEVYK